MVIKEEMLQPICTDCGLPMRMSRIQLLRDEQWPSSKFGDKFGGDDGVGSQAVVDEQQPDVHVADAQVLLCRVKSQQNHNLYIDLNGGRQIVVGPGFEWCKGWYVS